MGKWPNLGGDDVVSGVPLGSVIIPLLFFIIMDTIGGIGE